MPSIVTKVIGIHITWPAVSALSSVAATLTVVAALWIAIRQWRVATGVAQLQGTFALIEQFQSGSIRHTRYFLNKNSSEIQDLLNSTDGLRRLDLFIQRTQADASVGPKSLTDIRRDLAFIEFIAILSLHGKLPRDLQRAYVAPTFLSYWGAALPLVSAIRRRRGDDVYLQHSEGFVNMISTGKLFTAGADRAAKAELRRIVAKSAAMAQTRLAQLRN